MMAQGQRNIGGNRIAVESINDGYWIGLYDSDNTLIRERHYDRIGLMMTGYVKDGMVAATDEQLNYMFDNAGYDLFDAANVAAQQCSTLCKKPHLQGHNIIEVVHSQTVLLELFFTGGSIFHQGHEQGVFELHANIANAMMEHGKDVNIDITIERNIDGVRHELEVNNQWEI